MVRIRELQKKPLIEAILELRWHVDPSRGDPNYSIFVGRLYNLLASKYPYHEQLPSSMIPSQMAANIAQHRFRVAEEKWPLVQVGPGIVTLNDTDNYTWDDFGVRANDVVKSVFKAYPKPAELKVTSLLLRYINSDECDYPKENLFIYLREKLKVNIVMPQQLFKNVDVKELPRGFNFQVAYPTKKPNGTVTLRFATGKHEGVNSVIWETIVRSINEDLPSLPRGINAWLKVAHSVTDYWFFTLIKGELERKFAGEN